MKLCTFRYGRTLVPGAAFFVVALIVVRFTYPLPPDSAVLLWYSRLDPLLLLQVVRWEGLFPAWGWLPLVTIALTLVAGRVFCGWLCPLGGLLALLQGLRRGAHSPSWTRHLLGLRFWWLAFLLGLLLLGSGWALYFSPFHLLTEELARISRQQIPWVLGGIVLLGILVFPRFWCMFFCPTGLLLSVLARWRHAIVAAPAECIHCGVCTTICPTGAAQMAPGVVSEDCLLCGRCSARCPVGHFTIGNEPAEGDRAKNGGLFTRREILRSGTALLVAGAALPLVLRPAGAQPLRPPGALEEDEFLARCSRCGRCMKVCPAECIKAMPISSGPALFLTPVIIPREARCELTQLCQKVCPTGALAEIPVDKTLIGLAEIDHSRCIGWAEGRLCLLCQEQCPLQAIAADDQNRPSILKERCVGCGACENGCPVDDPAIVVRSQPKRRRT